MTAQPLEQLHGHCYPIRATRKHLYLTMSYPKMQGAEVMIFGRKTGAGVLGKYSGPGAL